jgi:hypothetical protein
MKKFGLLLCLAWLALVFLPVSAQGDGTISEADYWQLVSKSRDILRNSPGPEELEALAARWEAVERVEFPDGRIVAVDNSGWAALMRAESPDARRLANLLGSLETERRVLALEDSQPGDLQALQDILARPEYGWAAGSSPSLLNDLMQRFLDWLSEILGDSEPVTISVGGGAVDLTALIASVLIGLMLAFSLASLFRDFVSESALDAENGHEEPLSARSALSRAETLSKDGDYRSAVRYLYLSALLILDERGLLYYDRTKTNREYLRRVAENPKIAGLLREVINVFDRVWYGFQPIDEETYNHYAARVRELENIQ